MRLMDAVQCLRVFCEHKLRILRTYADIHEQVAHLRARGNSWRLSLRIIRTLACRMISEEDGYRLSPINLL